MAGIAIQENCYCIVRPMHLPEFDKMTKHQSTTDRLLTFKRLHGSAPPATNCSSHEITMAGLSTVVPARKYARGHPPCPSTPEINSRKGQEDSAPTKFQPMRTNLSPEDLRNLLAKVIEVGVKLVLRNHAYRWKNNIWLQRLGVPTGLRLSGVIGRIVMDRWKTEMTTLMANNKMISYLLEKYVDDTEVVTENVAPGTRWDGEKLVISPEEATKDIETDRKRDSITMEAWKCMASSIIPGLDFTVDFCSKNDNGTVAMLDFQMWKVTMDDPNSPGKTMESLKYTFFEKEMSNPKVMDAASALPHKVKIATLTQEGVRRLCNTSRSLNNEHKCKILSRYLRKLQISGYSQKIRANVLESAVTTFRKKERSELLGVQPLHRLGSHNREARRREKLTGKTEWYQNNKKNSWKKKLAIKEQQISDKLNNNPNNSTKHPTTHHTHIPTPTPIPPPPMDVDRVTTTTDTLPTTTPHLPTQLTPHTTPIQLSPTTRPATQIQHPPAPMFAAPPPLPPPNQQ